MQINIPDITAQLVETSNNSRRSKNIALECNPTAGNDFKSNIKNNISASGKGGDNELPVEKKTKKIRFVKDNRKSILNLKRFRKKDKFVVDESEDEIENAIKARETHKIRNHLKKSCKIS
jgi:hypothetical protein